MKQQSSLKSFGRLFKYIRGHRADFYWGCFFSFLKKVFDVAPEIVIGITIDVVVNKEKSFLAQWGLATPKDQLIFLSALTLVIWVLESVCEYAHQIKWLKLAQAVQHNFRIEAYNHLQQLDMAYFEDRTTGGLAAILNDDINQLERFFNDSMNLLVQIVTSTVLIGAVFFAIAPKVAGFAFIPMPIIFISAFFFQKQAAPLYQLVREKAGVLSGRLSAHISGMATIHSFTAEARESARIRDASLQYVEANHRAIEVSARFNPLIRMGVLLGFLATFIAGGIAALHGELNVGSYGILVFLSQRLLWPLRDLAKTIDLFERAMASANRVLDLLTTPISLEASKPSVTFSSQMGVQFNNVSFSYSNQVPVLKNVAIDIPPGKTVAIVGPTGSGKSTLTKLLLRFYSPESGEIMLGGKRVSECDPKELRSQIGLVSQDAFLFDGTLFENIAYGKPGASRAEVMKAAKQAYADEFIDRLPQGLDTLVGERGQKLSGGQRQRISIARVILKNPPVLIFDEATSSIDNETESLIQKSLAEISKGRTTMIIAHRLSTVVHSDRIYVLSQGQIVEQGTHESLLKDEQLYAQLWNLQIRKRNDGPQAFL